MSVCRRQFSMVMFLSFLYSRILYSIEETNLAKLIVEAEQGEKREIPFFFSIFFPFVRLTER